MLYGDRTVSARQGNQCIIFTREAEDCVKAGGRLLVRAEGGVRGRPLGNYLRNSKLLSPVCAVLSTRVSSSPLNPFIARRLHFLFPFTKARGLHRPLFLSSSS